MTRQVVGVREVAEILDISESKAYKIIKQLNSELADRGYITIPGKVSKAYFEEKVYGVHIAE